MRAAHFRRARRTAVGLVAAAALAVVGSAAPAMADSSSHVGWHSGWHGSRHRGTLLALGDSVPFGYRADQLPATYANPANFVGYPELVSADLHLDDINATCPGETTDSFLSVTAVSNGCESSVVDGKTVPGGYRTLFPLHQPYGKTTQSQLAYALQVLASHRDVQLITLQLGANDGLLCQQSTADACTSPAEVAALAAHVQANVSTALAALRGPGHYRGRIVVMNYYAVDYSAPAAQASVVLNAALARAAGSYGACVGDSFDAFLPAASKVKGSSITAGLVLPNDIHPTAVGQRLLADTVEATLRG